MQVKILKPSSKYLIKMRLVITLIAALVLLVGLVISVSIALDRSAGAGGAVLAIVLIAALDAIFWVVAFYYRSLSYEIQDDEVIVRAGIWTQSVKHVPYRTVTNLKVKRDILDRWLFGLGTLNIQTAGMSGTTGAEESLVGLVNVEEVYDTVATELRRFRGSMAPTAAEVEGDRVVTTPDALGEILTEVRAIRQALEER
jgi:uncharacterized membrane protein YdbT with pleckstrin-like domain